MRYWIGCSGWQYAEWRDYFYPVQLPKTKWFEFYTKNFNTVEINSTFYGIPTEATLLRWRENAPDAFRYSLKANRSITHYHRFHNTEKMIFDFYHLAALLAEKLGCILFQLPKTAKYSMDFLTNIVKQLSTHFCNVLEFQDESWWRKEVLDYLSEHNILFANINSPIINQPFQETGTISYLRFHGKQDWYQGLYGEKYIEHWLTAIKASPSKEVWCYLDNTKDAAAIKDAKTWQRLTQ